MQGRQMQHDIQRSRLATVTSSHIKRLPAMPHPLRKRQQPPHGEDTGSNLSIIFTDLPQNLIWHKPVAITCINRNCDRSFSSFSAMLKHIEIGGCDGGRYNEENIIAFMINTSIGISFSLPLCWRTNWREARDGHLVSNSGSAANAPANFATSVVCSSTLRRASPARWTSNGRLRGSLCGRSARGSRSYVERVCRFPSRLLFLIDASDLLAIRRVPVESVPVLEAAGETAQNITMALFFFPSLSGWANCCAVSIVASDVLCSVH